MPRFSFTCTKSKCSFAATIPTPIAADIYFLPIAERVGLAQYFINTFLRIPSSSGTAVIVAVIIFPSLMLFQINVTFLFWLFFSSFFGAFLVFLVGAGGGYVGGSGGGGGNGGKFLMKCST